MRPTLYERSLRAADAIGAKRTYRKRQEGIDPTKVTPSSHKPARNPAAQQSPGVLGCVLSFRSEAREALNSETARVHHTTRRRGGRVAARLSSPRSRLSAR